MRLRPAFSAPFLTLSLAALPGLVAAQEISVYAGFALTSEYVSSGLKQSDGPALQPYVEAEINGFYAGIWASNTDSTLVGAKSEVDLYFGYRNTVGALSYDLGYARYFYFSPDDDCCGEFTLALDYALGDVASVGLYVSHDPEANSLSPVARFDYYASDAISLATTYGRSDGSHNYWTAGGSYALSDTTALDLTWHDSNIDEGIAVLSLSMDFSLR
ncbi:hypothetical protein GEU84_008275 [Fertoebacter nigrum]|uniref:Porin n=1 Tax=Fertoeibacter niger TaxID=2656921 RepID=A0A8X8KP08_9RHOB|nr:TorF family putative porin [Fertoeibacter niger]NUB44376.1 hypothetical protein [Fertoeibacter niger]